MAEAVRIGALARRDPDARKELEFWERDLLIGALDDPDATRARLAAHSRGEAEIVELELFVDVAREAELTRVRGIRVSGVWFTRGAARQNAAHAHDVALEHLDELRDPLLLSGTSATAEALAKLPFQLRLDDELATHLAD